MVSNAELLVGREGVQGGMVLQGAFHKHKKCLLQICMPIFPNEFICWD